MIFLNKQVFVPRKPFQDSIVFGAQVKHRSGAPLKVPNLHQKS